MEDILSLPCGCVLQSPSGMRRLPWIHYPCGFAEKGCWQAGVLADSPPQIGFLATKVPKIQPKQKGGMWSAATDWPLDPKLLFFCLLTSPKSVSVRASKRCVQAKGCVQGLQGSYRLLVQCTGKKVCRQLCSLRRCCHVHLWLGWLPRASVAGICGLASLQPQVLPRASVAWLDTRICSSPLAHCHLLIPVSPSQTACICGLAGLSYK